MSRLGPNGLPASSLPNARGAVGCGFKPTTVTQALGCPSHVILPCIEEIAAPSKVFFVMLPDISSYLKDRGLASLRFHGPFDYGAQIRTCHEQFLHPSAGLFPAPRSEPCMSSATDLRGRPQPHRRSAPAIRIRAASTTAPRR